MSIAVHHAATEEPAEQKPSSLKGHDPPGLDDVSKLAALVAISLYVFGLLLVNTYLYRFGVADISLLQTKYIITGALTVTPAVLGITAPVYAIHMHKITPRRLEAMRQAQPQNLYDRINKETMIFVLRSRIVKWNHFFVILLMPFGLFLLFPATVNASVHERILGAVWFYCVSASTGFLGLMIVYLALGKPLPVGIERSANGIEVFGTVLLFVGMLAIYLSSFASRVYPLVPEQFGGGKPKHVVMLVKKDDVGGVAELGLPLDQTSTTAPLSILFEGSDIYVLGYGDGDHVVLSKDLVRGFRLVPEPRPRPPTTP